ncbi:hypothetical protein CYMTET_4961 [Cymbomonas tetramitiformis]|uniref:Uncharacterized protein n=1 Tax=Cymbomonas tetramitiformis TaxID=36881 RepID=A0AAE0LJZ2_9CHLO|nr:hypothetical protein CYMTET_4961 [Cymbomonas tetramitiformis]
MPVAGWKQGYRLGAEEWNGRKIWRSPTRAKLHTDSSLFVWGGVLNLKHTTRGLWSDELRHLHITHLELEAVYKTAQSFLRELTGKIEWHHHTVNRFTSDLPAQLLRYCDQWFDPGREGVDSLAYSWQGEVNCWVIPPWHLLNEVAYMRREEGCKPMVVAPYWPGQMCSSSRRPWRARCKRRAAGTDLPAGLPVGCMVQVYRPIDDDWCSGTVGSTTDGRTRVAYGDGDVELLDMSKEKYKVLGETPRWKSLLRRVRSTQYALGCQRARHVAAVVHEYGLQLWAGSVSMLQRHVSITDGTVSVFLHK